MERATRQYPTMDRSLFLRDSTRKGQRLEQLLTKIDKHLTPFRKTVNFSDWTTLYYNKELNLNHQKKAALIITLADSVVPNLDLRYYNGLADELQNHARALITGSLVELLQGFGQTTNKDGTPGPQLMANRERYMVDHSLHATRILADLLPEAPLGTLIATIYHDYYEDVPEQHIRNHLAMRPEEGLEEACAKMTARHTLGMDPALQEEFRVAQGAARRLTMRHGADYFSTVDAIIDERFREGEEGYAAEQREIQYALLAKLADKISAVQTIDPFTNDKKLRTFGKLWKVINVARDYLAKHEDEHGELLNAIQELTIQASVEAAKSTDYERARHIFETPSEVRHYAANEIMHNNYLLAGGFSHVDISPNPGESEMEEQFPVFSGTLRSSMILSMHLEHEEATIPTQYILPNESKDDARRRLLAEQQRYVFEVTEGADADHKYDRRLLAFSTLFKKKAINPEFRLEGL